MSVKHKRILWALLTPPMLLLFALVASGLTLLLDETFEGRLLLLVFLILAAVNVGCVAWTWPVRTDDDA